MCNVYLTQSGPGREDETMEVCHDFSARQHSSLHCCHCYTKHRGFATGYYFYTLFDSAVLSSLCILRNLCLLINFTLFFLFLLYFY